MEFLRARFPWSGATAPPGGPGLARPPGSAPWAAAVARLTRRQTPLSPERHRHGKEQRGQPQSPAQGSPERCVTAQLHREHTHKPLSARPSSASAAVQVAEMLVGGQERAQRKFVRS